MIILFFMLTLAVFFLKWGFQKSKRRNPLEDLLGYLMLFTFGFTGIGNAIAHFFYTDRVISFVGFSSFEIGVANLALGAIGILSFWMRRGFLNAALLANTIWFWGTAVGLLRLDRFTPNQSVNFLVDLLIPVVVWTVYYNREKSKI